MVSKEKLIDEIEFIADKIGGDVKKMLRCNSMGRQSRVITIEYNVKEDN